jgi:TRAP-type C4-dicarboxylate transport system substrate-binding protein
MGLDLRAVGALGLGMALVCAGPSTAKEFVYGAWVAAKHGVNTAGLEPLFKQVEADTKGAVTWKLLAGGQVVSARSTLSAIRDRVVDGGMVIPPFTQKELAANNVLFDLQMAGSDPVAVAGAATEVVMLHCPECLDEYKRFKNVYLGGYGITPYRLICAPQITQLSEMAGKRVRATGGSANLIQASKSVPVNIPPNEGVEAMQRGALDCAHAPFAWLKSYGYIDVAKNIIEMPLGFPRGQAMFAMNRDSWNSLSAAEKKTLLKHMPAATARATIIGYMGEDDEARKEAVARGIKFHKGGKELAELIAKYRGEERARVIADGKKMGVKAPEQIADALDRTLPKWEKLSKAINNDVDKFTSALQTEIYDKLDAGKM